MRYTQTIRPFMVAVLIAIIAIVPILLVTAAQDTTIVPIGPDQSQPRPAYRAIFQHISQGERAHWVQQGFHDSDPVYSDDSHYHAAGTVVVPDGICSATPTACAYDTLVVSDTVHARPALALDATGTRVALFRSTVSDPTYGDAAWELADVRETFDSYLWGALRYDILDEEAITTANLSRYALLILPAVRQGNEAEVVAALGEDGLQRINDFVQQGGFLYAQSNGAVIAEAAGVVPTGTVDLDERITLAPDMPRNSGHMAIVDPESPLTFSWITSTLYLLNEPTYRPQESLHTVAEFDNLDGATQPAILSSDVGRGTVILVNGHPTATTHRSQVQLFFNAIFWALGHPAELFGQAIQTYNPELDPHLLPAYEPGTPVSVTLTFNNVWDTPMHNVVITTTVASGFRVVPDSVSPPGIVTDGGVYGKPAGESTLVQWYLGEVPPGDIHLSFVAETDDEVLSSGNLTFATSQASFTHNQRPHSISHPPFKLTARMAARLITDRDIEPDRHFFIPAEGLYLDVDMPIENKEDTLASNVVITDVVLCASPILDIDDQETILDQNNGQTVWVRNEPFFYNERGRPYIAPDGYAPGDTISLTDCDGPPAVFDVPFGTHGEISTPGLQGTGNYVTIPITYSHLITLTNDSKLLLPTKVLTWTIGEYPGYYYGEPAIRYGIHSSELFSRTVTFAGDPGIVPEQVVVQGTGGSVYTHPGDYPIFYRDHVSSGIVAVPQTPLTPTITYDDIWTRAHTTTMRAAFYDLYSWASCQCGPGMAEQHAGLNVTFGMKADLNQDGTRDDDVLLYPGRMDGADLDIMIKSRNLGGAINANQMVIDMGMFRGLGIWIAPRSGNWETSWHSPNAGTSLIEVQRVAGYDHLYFQHGLGNEETETIILEAVMTSYPGTVAEGLLKLHDGARLTYRQQFAGPSRYEVYDTHVQGVIGAGAEITVRKQGTPILVSTYGDTVYYVITVDDADDPRSLRRNGPGDPFLQSYGFGDTAATTYIGGREERTMLHSIVSPGERTQLRVEINNNSGDTFRNVVVEPQPRDGITISRSYTTTVPAPIYYDLPFLYLETIPDAGRAVYYFDVVVDADYTGPRGQRVEIPIAFSADGAPPEFTIPSAQLGITDDNGKVYYVSSPATELELKDHLPPSVHLMRAVEATAEQVDNLTAAIDQEQRATIFAGFTNTVSFTQQGDGEVIFDVPETALERIYDPYRDHRYILVAQAVVTPTQAGPGLTNFGAQTVFTDEFAMDWHVNSKPLQVEVHGAAVRVTYACSGVTTRTLHAEQPLTPTTSIDTCILSAGMENDMQLTTQIVNIGDYPAQDTTVHLVIPPGITVDEASITPAASSVTSDTMTWNIGDMAPGWRMDVSMNARVRLAEDGAIITPDAPTQLFASLADQEASPHTKDIQIISYSDGHFFEPFSDEIVNGMLGHAFHLPVHVQQQGGETPTTMPTATPVRTSTPGVETPTATSIPEQPTSRPPLQTVTPVATDNPGTTVTPSPEEPTDTPETTPTTTTPEPTTPVPPVTPEPSTPEVGKAVLRISYQCADTTGGDSLEACLLEMGKRNHIALNIIVTNVGDAAARDIIIEQGLAAGIQLVDASPAADAINGQMITWKSASLQPGAMIVFKLTLDIPVNLDGGVARGTTPTVVQILTSGKGSYTNAATGERQEQMLAGAYYLPIRSEYGVALSINYGCAGTSASTNCTMTAGMDNEATLAIEIANQGTHAAEQLIVSLNLASDVEFVETNSTSTVEDNTVRWSVGTLLAGEKRTLHLTISATSNQIAEAQAQAQQSIQVINQSYGRYIDTGNQQQVEQFLGEAYALPIVQAVPSTTNAIYLPLIMRAHTDTTTTQDGVDLVVTNFLVQPANPSTGQPVTITATVANQGNKAAAPFWVDLYISPDPVPAAAGVRWEGVCTLSPCRGIAWYVPGLEAGESITLTSEPQSYAIEQSIWDGTFAVGGTHNLYIYADSWNGDDPSGSVDETDETNNRADLLELPIAGDAMLTALPPRPDLPPREMERGR